MIFTWFFALRKKVVVIHNNFCWATTIYFDLKSMESVLILVKQASWPALKYFWWKNGLPELARHLPWLPSWLVQFLFRLYSLILALPTTETTHISLIVFYWSFYISRDIWEIKDKHQCLHVKMGLLKRVSLSNYGERKGINQSFKKELM